MTSVSGILLNFLEAARSYKSVNREGLYVGSWIFRDFAGKVLYRPEQAKVNTSMKLWRLRFWMSVGMAGFVQTGYTADLPKSLPPHPRLLFSQKELPEIKQRAAGQSKARFQSLKNQADEWLNRQIKLPDRGGQWFHWYSCTKHGTRLRTEGPTRHVCPVDQEVFTGYPYDDVVISSEHNGLAGAIRTLGIVYQVTGETRYAMRAKQILLAYADKYPSYPLHDTRGQAKVGGGKVGPQTLDEPTTMITGTGAGRHTEDRVPVVIARREGKATAYLWCVDLGTNEDRLELQSEEVKLPDASPAQSSVAAVRVKTAYETHVIVANPDGKLVKIGDQPFEGRIGLFPAMKR
jgi:hypothetical protein